MHLCSKFVYFRRTRVQINSLLGKTWSCGTPVPSLLTKPENPRGQVSYPRLELLNVVLLVACGV